MDQVEIGYAVRRFTEHDEHPQFWGYFPAYDWVAFTWLFGMKRFRTQLVLVEGVAILIGSTLMIAILIDHPFSGDLTVSYAPFQEGALASLWR